MCYYEWTPLGKWTPLGGNIYSAGDGSSFTEGDSKVNETQKCELFAHCLLWWRRLVQWSTHYEPTASHPLSPNVGVYWYYSILRKPSHLFTTHFFTLFMPSSKILNISIYQEKLYNNVK